MVVYTLRAGTIGALREWRAAPLAVELALDCEKRRPADRPAAALFARDAMATQAPVADVVLRAGFQNIIAGSTLREATMRKGEKLYASSHVFDVNERVSAASSLLRARCVRQANVSQEAYSITLKVVSALPCCFTKFFVHGY